jgi:hypothetical protein
MTGRQHDLGVLTEATSRVLHMSMLAMMRYIEPSIGFLCFLWVTIAAPLAGSGLRTWQAKIEALLGLSGMSFFGLILYLRWSARTNFFSGKGFLAGMVFGLFVSLWLEGSWNVFKKFAKKSQDHIGE